MRELEQTEKAYVRDLELLCSGFVEPLRAEHVLTRDEELAVFSNCEVIKGVNQELLAALQQPAAAVSRCSIWPDASLGWLRSCAVMPITAATLSLPTTASTGCEPRAPS